MPLSGYFFAMVFNEPDCLIDIPPITNSTGQYKISQPASNIENLARLFCVHYVRLLESFDLTGC